MTWLILLIILAAILYFFLVAPRPGARVRAGFLIGKNLAHRGLFSADIPENSLAAIKLAIQAGYGIVIDVRFSKDGVPVAFSDENLYRLTGVSPNVNQLDYRDLASLSLLGGSERIPTLDEVLTLVDGMVPVLLEIKSSAHLPDLWMQVITCLAHYSGEVAIQSASPELLCWLRAQAPLIPRGQVGGRNGQNRAASALLLNWRTRPDFITYHYQKGGSIPLQICKRMGGAVAIGGIVSTMEAYRGVHRIFDALIFEHIAPSTDFIKGQVTAVVVKPTAAGASECHKEGK